jgi:ubiquinone/menaquinone biosynthesis C-methylase UbiE
MKPMQGANGYLSRISRYWDAVADCYLELFRDEFEGKPYDREVIASFAASLNAGARVCDAGCGPCGHVTHLLASHGLDVVGVDISPRCVTLARQEQPSLRFEEMNIADMEFGDCELQGVVAYYALHYQPKSTLPAVIQEFSRVLCDDGRLMIVAKDGDGEGFIDDPMGSGQQVFWCALSKQELQELVCGNGFDVLKCDVREPLPSEIATRRTYLIAKKSARRTGAATAIPAIK